MPRSLTSPCNGHGLAATSRRTYRSASSRAVEPLESRTLFAAGDLDPSWGVGGQARIDVPNTTSESLLAVAVANGRTVLGGGTGSAGGSAPVQAVLAVLDSSGKPVTSFSSDGVETKALSVPGGVLDLVVQPDNKIVVIAGTVSEPSDSVVLARFNTNGLLDTTFGGGDGQVPLPFGRSVALAPGGKIVVAGALSGGRAGALRFTAAGAADGQAVASVGGDNTAQTRPNIGDVAVQPDGRVLVAGDVYLTGGIHGFSSDGFIVRFNEDLSGTDATFGGGDGFVRFDSDDDTEPFDGVDEIAIDGLGRVVAAVILLSQQLSFHRLLPDGSPDPAFEVTEYRSASAGDLTLAPDGKIVVSGGTTFVGNFLLRLDPDGGWDDTFGGGDGLLEEGSGDTVAGYRGDVQPDGRIITAGEGDGMFQAFRHLAEGGDDSGTVEAFDAYDDAYVRDGSHANTNFGNSAQLQVKQGATGWNRESHLQFSLSTVTSVESAKLHVFGRLDNTQAASATFNVYNAADTDWSEDTLTWNNKSPAGAVVRGTKTVSGTTGAWYEVDLTSFVQAELAAGRTTLSLVLKAAAASPSNIVIDSNETGNAPQMVVKSGTVTPPPTEPATLRAGADAYARDGSHANTNFGNATALQVKQGATGWNRDAYLRFDLSAVDTVSSAELRLFGRLDNTQAASAGFTVYNAANTTWSETGLTWNNKPAAGTTVRGSGTVTGTTGQWYELDLTAFLQAEKAAGRHVVTLVIKATSASPSTILFDSDEAAAGTRPELVVA
jgi:uncharacterized delta-60 repeat protein